MTFPTIEITTLPNEWTPENLAIVLPTYKEFRLFSLTSSPNAFAMTYNQEIVFPDETWIQRLTNSDTIHFIATHDPDEQYPAAEAWKRSPWLGSLVLVRKSMAAVAKEQNSFDGGLHVDRAGITQRGLSFHMNAVFLDPGVRGKGLGKKLLLAGIDFVRGEIKKDGMEKVGITTLVDSWNEIAIALYASQGFVKIGVDWYIVDKERREAV